MSDLRLCRFCDRERKLINAHIVPRAFYSIPDQASGDVLKLVSNRPHFYPKTTRIGLYDPGILCDECEGRFSDTDTYGAKLLLQSQDKFVRVYHPHTGEMLGYEIHEYDYVQLKLFFLSLLWRAEVSQHEAFSKVRLGPFASRLRDMLRAGDPGEPDAFAVTLGLYSNEASASMFISPVGYSLDGINGYRIKAQRYLCHVKADRRPHVKAFRNVQLTPTPPFIVLHEEWRAGPDYRAAKSMVSDLAERGIEVFKNRRS